MGRDGDTCKFELCCKDLSNSMHLFRSLSLSYQQKDWWAWLRPPILLLVWQRQRSEKTFFLLHATHYVLQCAILNQKLDALLATLNDESQAISTPPNPDQVRLTLMWRQVYITLIINYMTLIINMLCKQIESKHETNRYTGNWAWDNHQGGGPVTTCNSMPKILVECTLAISR